MTDEVEARPDADDRGGLQRPGRARPGPAIPGRSGTAATSRPELHLRRPRGGPPAAAATDPAATGPAGALSAGPLAAPDLRRVRPERSVRLARRGQPRAGSRPVGPAARRGPVGFRPGPDQGQAGRS